MRVVIQRVLKASVMVDRSIVGNIDRGLLVLLGIHEDDTEDDIEWIIRKMVNLRIFPDEDSKMNLSILDVKGACLVVSQFTLHASTKKGNRPSFLKSAKPVIASQMYERFCNLTKMEGLTVEKGIFGADMQVSLVNDGPVTILLDSKTKNNGN